MYILFSFVVLLWLMVYSEGPVSHGRASGIENGIHDIIKGFTLLIVGLSAFRWVPKQKYYTVIIMLTIAGMLCWFGRSTLIKPTHWHQFFNAFLIFNVFGILLVISKRLNQKKLELGVFSTLVLLILVSFMSKNLALTTGFRTEHDYVEEHIMYHDEAHTIIASKETKKGYKKLGERLEFHENGKLKFYEDYETPVGKPWIEYHKDGKVYSITGYFMNYKDDEQVKELYGVHFDDKGLIMREAFSHGQVLQYHYNGYVFYSGYSWAGKPIGKWYFYSYQDGSVVDSVDHTKKQKHDWYQRNDLKTNRYREKDSTTYSTRYDQKLMEGVRHYKPDSLYEFALELKERFDQQLNE